MYVVRRVFDAPIAPPIPPYFKRHILSPQQLINATNNVVWLLLCTFLQSINIGNRCLARENEHTNTSCPTSPLQYRYTTLSPTIAQREASIPILRFYEESFQHWVFHICVRGQFCRCFSSARYAPTSGKSSVWRRTNIYLDGWQPKAPNMQKYTRLG